MLRASVAPDARVSKLPKNILRTIRRAVGYDLDFHSISRIIQGKEVGDPLSQKRCTVVDCEDNTHRGQDRSLLLLPRLQTAAQVHPERIPHIGIEHEACGAPKCVALKVCSTHLFLLVFEAHYCTEQRSDWEEAPWL